MVRQLKNFITSLVVLGLFSSSFWAYANVLSKDANQHTTYASIFPVNQAQLSSPMTGMITKIYFHPGESFKKGDILVRFDCQEIDLKEQRALAEFKSASTMLESTRELIQLNSTSKTELAKAESQYNITKADLNIMRYQQKQCDLLAPYSGEVTHQAAQENETVKIDDPLIDIVNNDNLEVKMYIPSVWLTHVKVGTAFTLRLDELKHQDLLGKVSKIVSQVDPASQSILVYGEINKMKSLIRQHKVFSGMSGVADFSIKPN